MHWAQQAARERMQFARTTNDPERRAVWVELAKKHHRIYMKDKRENAKHIEWLNRKEAEHLSRSLSRDGQLVVELFGSFMEGMGDRPATRELLSECLIEDVVGVLGC